MQNIRFFDVNAWDSQGLEGTATLISWPIENTQKRWKTQSARFESKTGQYIRTTGGSSQLSKGFFIFYHNITASGKVTVKGSSDNWLSTPFSQVMTRTDNLFLFIPPSPLTFDDYGFFIEDGTNPGDYLEIGRVWYGDYFEPYMGYSGRIKEREVFPDIELQSDGGQVSIIQKESYNTFEIPFDAIYDLDRYNQYIRNIRGTSRPFVIQKQKKGYQGNDFPDPEENSYYVSCQSYQKNPIAGETHRVNLTLREER
jgi:hypothetical protein